VLIGREQHRTELERLAAVPERMLANAKSVEAIQKTESLRRRDPVSRVNLAYREYLDDNVGLADLLLEGCPADLREWEWSHTHRLGHSELKTFAGSHDGHDVWCLAFSPRGGVLAVGAGPWFQVGEGQTAELVMRALKTGAEIFALAGLTGAVQALAFSPDGRWLVVARGFSGKEPGAVLAAFDWESGKKARAASERGFRILSLAYSPDGRTIATGCGWFNDYTNIGYARFRDAATGDPQGVPLAGAPGGVLSVAFCPDGRQLALASRDVVDVCELSSPGRPIIHQLRGM
jgi:hypothetical protein